MDLHPWRAFLALALAFLLLATSPLPAAGPGPASPPEAGAAIRFRTDAPRSDLASVGARLLEEYGAFLVAEGPPGSVDALVTRGHRADPMPEASVVHFLQGPLDVRGLNRALSPAWTVAASGAAAGIVHFRVPIKAAWRDGLESLGLRVLRYLPENAFLVRGPPVALEGAWTLPHVDWVGPYEASWKIRSSPEGLRGLADVRIVALPGERTESLAASLGHLGIPGQARSGSDVGILGAYGRGDFRWLRARVPAGILPSIAALPQVEFIEPVRPPRLLNEDASWAIQTNRFIPGNSTPDMRYAWAGLDGRGQFVAISDTGVDYDADAFTQSGAVIATGDLYNVTDPARRKVVRYHNVGVETGQVAWLGSGTWDPWSIQDSEHLPGGQDCTFGHGTAVASILTGNDNWIAGGGDVNDGLGAGAKLVVQDIGTIGPDPTQCGGDADLLSYLPDDLEDLFLAAYEDPLAPVRVHSNSWGTDDDAYDVQARSVDAFVWEHKDFTVLFAAGNAGSGAATVNTPGTAKDVVTVAGAGNPDAADATTGPNDIPFQNSRGPASDGRLKPTILTIFDGDSAMSDGNARSGTALANAHWAGTSYATPAAAAAAAIIRQYLLDGWYPSGQRVPGNARSPSAALVRAMLIASAVQITGRDSALHGNTWPNTDQGFGRVQLSNVLRIAAYGEPVRAQIHDESDGLLTGEQATYRFAARSGTTTLKFVLAWSDYPGTLAAAKALVNDLDLEVTAPNGTVYRGNVFGTFADGQSVPGGTFDSRNVEEAVVRKAPATGEWTVRVIAANVPVGPQPFALVAVADLDAAYGRVSVDRNTYGFADTIGIEVEDANAGTVQVQVSSTFEPLGEAVSLTGNAVDELWRGTIPTSLGPAGTDGLLQVRDGDVVMVTYDDGLPVHSAVATARVDGNGPTVSNVVTDRPSSTSVRVRWRTDEPASSGVRFGTSPAALTSSADAADLVTDHGLGLNGLQADTLYYFDVVSRDRIGQETRDTNSGRHYRLRTAALGDVLLVIGDDSFPPEREASFAASLATGRWTWSLWRVDDAGPPPLAFLQAHRAVIWQVGLEQYPPFDGSERALVKAYLDGGGRLLVSSHDTLWALGATASQYYDPAAAAWIRGVLKADYSCDPTTIGRVTGLGGDPISGGYTGGIAYTPHRDGGAADEFSALGAGGTASTVWTDGVVAGCNPGNRPVGLRWFSSANNGTAGNGAWGGTASRLVYFAFELTGVDTTSTDLRPSSAERAAVLDNALRWLVGTAEATLDRDHPDVQVTSPNAGVYGGSTLDINWTASVTGGTLAGFSVYASGDLGQTWTLLVNLTGASRAYVWDLASVPNGDRYLVRVVGRDAGTPSLQGIDESDAAFSIRRPGGDLLGPGLWAGSVRVSPNPPGAAAPVTVLATADDGASGGSVLATAEFFFASSEPPANASGTGIPMLAADGTFDEVVEDLVWPGSLAAAPGASCAWVHAEDVVGNWGPYASICFVVVSAGPDVTPPASAQKASGRLRNARADVEVGWDRAWDDSLFGGTATYRVLRATTPRGAATDISGDVLADGSARYVFVDAGAGASDPSDYFYWIQSVDSAGNAALSGVLVAKVRVGVGAGANLLAVPVEAGDPSLAALAADVTWADASAYDACSAGYPWRVALPSEAASLFLGPGQGFWINATAAGDLLVVGSVPAAARVPLCEGWNLVGLAGFATGITVGQVKALTGADAVVGFEPLDPYHTRALADAEVLGPGQGIWVHVPADVTWSFAGW